MLKIIKRGGFREQAARQLNYKDSVNQRRDIRQKQTQADNTNSEKQSDVLEATHLKVEESKQNTQLS